MLESPLVRTTVTLDDDVAAAVEEARRARAAGFSETVNDLIRKGLLYRKAGGAFVQRSRQVGVTIDVSNVAEALEIAEAAPAR